MGIDEMDNEGIRFPFYYLSLSLSFFLLLPVHGVNGIHS